jgi:AMMECR1 domain-containing protein
MKLLSLLCILGAVVPAGAGLPPADLRAAATDLARRALAHAIDPAAPEPTNTVDALRAAGPAFVTVVLDGATRACQGTLHASTPSLADEIVAAAARAVRGDSRHPSLSRRELDRAQVIVSLPRDVRPLAGSAGDPEPIDPRRFGLAIETANAAGILLPGEAKTFEWMLAETRRRAGASAADPGRALAFQTTVLGEVPMPALEHH